MASQSTNFQCPACTGPLHFDGATGKLKCDYCESEFTPEEIEALYKEKTDEAEEAFEGSDNKKKSDAAVDGGEPKRPEGKPSKPQQKPAGAGKVEGWDVSDMSDDWGSDASHMAAYHCTSCGAELICEATTAATECPYCGNPTIIPGQFAGALKPDYIIPFKIDKERAMAALREHYRGKKLLPRVFSAENHIQEVKGIYVPFWLFDGTAEADVTFYGERVTRTETPRESIIRTAHYDLHRAGKVRFEKIPADASKRMDDALMDSVEPYDYNELKPFSLSYLPGYLADKYDVSVKECAKRADLRAENTAMDAMYSTVAGQYTAIRTIEKNISLKRGKVTYALLPVWILNTMWNGNKYIFAINGQTGKIVGDLPEDKGLALRYRLIIGIIIGVIIFLIYCIGIHL